MAASPVHRLLDVARTAAFRRSALAVAVAVLLSAAGAAAAARARMADAEAQLADAAQRLDELTAIALPDQRSRAAIAWGYAERLRLGLESPFRLVEAASRDPRLALDERRTVALALLSHITRGATHQVDPAALDGLGPIVSGRPLPGEAHLRRIESAIVAADDPRIAELGIRLGYTLAAAEQLVEASAPVLVAQAAALVADRELARREAIGLLRSTRGDALEAVARRREARRFYVERPVLLAANDRQLERAVAVGEGLLDGIRSSRQPDSLPVDAPADGEDASMRRALYGAGAVAPPNGGLAVTLQRYRHALRGAGIDAARLAKAHNPEMFVGALEGASRDRGRRSGAARMLLAAAVSMRAAAQERVWFPGDSTPTAAGIVAATGLAGISFDADVPTIWRPYFLAALSDGIRDLRRVLPGFRLDQLRIRFRRTAPADSALAMHDPRTRTLHLPVYTAAGTLTHELAHDLDRQSAVRQGHAGYRSDFVARAAPQSGASRLAASLRALTEETGGSARRGGRAERPAEIFATRVDWYVAQALAVGGVSSGFLSAVQDELLTGHVVHPERLRSASRSQPLRTALQEMTAMAPAWEPARDPSLQTLLRWALAAPIDSRVAAAIVRGERAPWEPTPLGAGAPCDAGDDARVRLVRLAAEARARGWVRQRAQWLAPGDRPAWARAALGSGPWSGEAVESRVARLRDHVLLALAKSEQLPSGLAAHAGPLAARAQCGGRHGE